MTVERRFLTQEFRVSEQGEAPKIAGYAAVFDTPSEDMGWIEEIDPHAFDTVMAGQHDVRALWNHNDDVVLGRESAGTLRLNVDARGLAYEIDPPDTTAAKDPSSRCAGRTSVSRALGSSPRVINGQTILTGQ